MRFNSIERLRQDYRRSDMFGLLLALGLATIGCVVASEEILVLRRESADSYNQINENLQTSEKYRILRAIKEDNLLCNTPPSYSYENCSRAYLSNPQTNFLIPGSYFRDKQSRFTGLRDRVFREAEFHERSRVAPVRLTFLN